MKFQHSVIANYGSLGSGNRENRIRRSLKRKTRRYNRVVGLHRVSEAEATKFDADFDRLQTSLGNEWLSFQTAFALSINGQEQGYPLNYQLDCALASMKALRERRSSCKVHCGWHVAA